LPIAPGGIGDGAGAVVPRARGIAPLRCRRAPQVRGVEFTIQEAPLRGSRWSKPLAVALGLTLVAAGCGDDDDEEDTTDTTEQGSSDTTAGGTATDFKGCEVTDTGGVDDRSFNQTAYEGLVSAADELGFEESVLESQSAADFEPNIQAHIDAGCDLIITVGFLLGDATAAAAEANPDQNFAIVDFDFFDVDAGEDITFDNVRELTFATDEAAFLAGYVAAAVSETGVIGTYGGINIPTVTIFMNGLAAGIEQYNTDTGESVTLAGWDPATQEGLFTGDFENVDNGRNTTEQLLDQNADIILPVAGPVGQGTIEAIRAGGGTQKVIWVDTDGCESVPDACDLLLTSIMKNMDVAVHDVTVAAAEGSFEGGIYTGTLENDGVGIAPFHEYEDAVPQDIKDRLEELREQIISGEITVGG
ncbi:MAG TPA: BMP family ABC transporter substrate-binding protein, partial [Acidimicrobiales bacterium]|nr:BMP family ABC transporter substrate-binding protein [Acidimicrobiales bacterium]